MHSHAHYTCACAFGEEIVACDTDLLRADAVKIAMV